MRNQQRTGWLATLGVVALFVVGASGAAAAPGGAQPAVKAPAGAAGMQVFIDPATGKIRPATEQEMKMMADRLKAFLDRSSVGLKVQEHSNGMLSMSLQGGFLNVWVASVGSNGVVTNACVTNQAAAQAILAGQGAPAYEVQ